MLSPPDLSRHGYQAQRRLGHNPQGGRSTWLGRSLSSGQPVVLKLFRFTDLDPTANAYLAHQHEITVLQGLQHPQIPAFIDSFELDGAQIPSDDTSFGGFCIVQAWCDAPPMGARHHWSHALLARTAESLLNVLCVLQDQLPPLVHRDITPQNVLVDDAGRAYLVDFGLARPVRAESSTYAIGTPGFMPPEQVLGRPVDEATDLYAAGACLIAAITDTPTRRLSERVDDHLRFSLDDLPPSLNPDFVAWLGRMVAPDRDHRFATARQALEAFKAVGTITAPPRRPAPKPRRHAPKPRTTPPSRAASRGRARSSRAVLTAAAVTALVVLGGVATFLASRSAAPTPHAQRPILCDGPLRLTQSLHIRGSVVGITAREGCVLTAAGIIIESDLGIVVQGGRVDLTSVTLRTRRTGIEIRGGVVRLTDVTIDAQGSRAIMAREGRLEVHGGSFRAEQFGIDGTDAELRLDGSRLVGGRAALAVSAGVAQLKDVTLESPKRALQVGRQAQVTLHGGTLNGGLSVTPPGTLRGLETAEIHLGPARNDSWAALGCAPIRACLHAAGVLGSFAVRARIPIDPQGHTSAPTYPQAQLPPTVRTCLDRAFANQSLPDPDNRPHTLVCDASGQVTAGGDLMLSTAFDVRD